MTSQPPGGRWVRRHPVLTVLWLIVAGLWLAATVAVYDDDPGISIFAYVVPMAPVTAIVFGLGVLSDRIRRRRSDGPDSPSILPERPAPQVLTLKPDAASVQRTLDDESQRQRDLALRLGQREAELGRREADLRLREALLQSESSRQPGPGLLPESKPLSSPVMMPPDRLPDQSAPAKFCFNCGAWFARDDQTCRLCGARRVGAEA